VYLYQVDSQRAVLCRPDRPVLLLESGSSVPVPLYTKKADSAGAAEYTPTEIDIDTDLFKGKMVVRLAVRPGLASARLRRPANWLHCPHTLASRQGIDPPGETGTVPGAGSAAHRSYFRGKRRLTQTVVQGSFKRPIPMRSAVTGQQFDRPLVNVPGRWIVKKGFEVIRRLSPLLDEVRGQAHTPPRTSAHERARSADGKEVVGAVVAV
jgi:hypothetical protein